MNQIVSAVLKAVLVTLIGTIASIAVEKIRRYNQDKDEEDNYHYHPGWDEHEDW